MIYREQPGYHKGSHRQQLRLLAVLLSVSRGSQCNLAGAQASPLRDSIFRPKPEAFLYEQPFQTDCLLLCKTQKKYYEIAKNFQRRIPDSLFRSKTSNFGIKDGRRVQ